MRLPVTGFFEVGIRLPQHAPVISWTLSDGADRTSASSVIYPTPARRAGAGDLTDEGSDDIWFDRLPPRRRRTWTHSRHDRTGLWASVVAVVAVIAIVAGVLVLYPQPAGPAPSIEAVQVAINMTAPPRSVPSSFWGINVGPNVLTSTTLADAASESPARVVRFPGGASGDAFNYTTGALTNSSGVSSPAVENFTDFAAWCRTIDCSPILELPGEIDDPATAAYYVSYVEETFGLHPLAWEIGNEPALWTHFGMPWSRWNVSQDLTPSASQYARVVQAYVAAIHAVDPDAPVLGLPGVGTGSFDETTWINATVALNGPNISGVAIHVYPAGAGPTTGANLTGYLASASGPGSMAPRVAADLAALEEDRPGLPLYVTELGTGLANEAYAPYLDSFPSVPYVASEIITAMLSGVALGRAHPGADAARGELDGRQRQRAPAPRALHAALSPGRSGGAPGQPHPCLARALRDGRDRGRGGSGRAVRGQRQCLGGRGP